MHELLSLLPDLVVVKVVQAILTTVGSLTVLIKQLADRGRWLGAALNGELLGVVA